MIEFLSIIGLVLPLGALVAWLHMRRQVQRNVQHNFAAFLRPVQPDTRLASRTVRDKPLLVARMALLALLAWALTGPVRTVELPGGAVRHVIVDASWSMGLVYPGEEMPFELALARAARWEQSGARLHFCGAGLMDSVEGPLHLAMNLSACLADLPPEEDAVLLTDGLGAEPQIAGHPQLQVVQVGRIPDSQNSVPAPPVQVTVTQGGAVQIEHRFDRPIQVLEESAQSGAMQCEAATTCELRATRARWLTIRVAAGSGWQGEDRVFGRAQEFVFPLQDPRRTILVVSSAQQAGLYSGHHLLVEALESMAASQDSLFVRYAHAPEDLAGFQGLVVLHWSVLEDRAWQAALQTRSPDSALWVLPAASLPDTIVPVSLQFAFGTYRGWLEDVSQARLGDDGTGSTAPVFRRISLAETGDAVVVARDERSTPLVLWQPADRVLFFLTGIDTSLSHWGLTPGFVPLLARWMEPYGPVMRNSVRCTAGHLQQTEPCGDLAAAVADGARFVVPDWAELQARTWVAGGQNIAATSGAQKVPFGSWLAVLILLAAACIPAVARMPGKKTLVGLLAACLLWPDPSLLLAAEKKTSLLPGVAEALPVGIFADLPVDPGRLRAFKSLAQKLDKRGNIRLQNPLVADRDKASGSPPVLYWSNLCRLTPADIVQARDAIVDAFTRGAVWWVEDCAGPGERSLAFEELTRLLRQKLVGSNWERVRSDHVIFKSYYLLNRIQGRYGAGGERVVTSGGMPVVLYTPQDLTGLVSGGRISEQVVRSYVNIFFYLLMGDYKEDGIHVPYLMKRLQRSRR